MATAYNPYDLLVEVIIHNSSNEGNKIEINKNKILSQISNCLENEKIIDWINDILFEAERLLPLTNYDVKTNYDDKKKLYLRLLETKLNLPFIMSKKKLTKFWDIEAQLYNEE